jgi:cytidine deaminase
LAASDDDRWTGDRRVRKDDRRTHERRSGTDRRVDDRGHPDGDRRSHQERRRGERRSGQDRRDESAWQPVALDAEGVPDDEPSLVAAATDAREFARAQFSNFKVGAALETDTGVVVTGCNVENATYGLTMCAERVALYKALSYSKDLFFTRIAIVADTEDPTPPCGSCRQLLWEYCGDIEVVLANLSEVKQRMRLSQLLPLPFDARLL